MDIRKLQRLIFDALEDVKAQDIKVYNTTGITELFDRVVIASGTSNRQTKALAASVRDKVKAAGGEVVSMEGEDTGEWVLVDLGDAIVHLMQPAIRAYYNLEEIWGGKPVALKPAAARKMAVASEDAYADVADVDGDDEVAQAKKPARKTTRPSLAPEAVEREASGALVKKPTRVAAKTPRTVASKKAPARKTAARTAVVRKTAARKSAA